MPLTYSQYLKVDELLSLQQPMSEGPEHDEVLFIIIHQVYELWFKQLLHEMDLLCGCFETHQTSRILGTLKRILSIQKTLVTQLDILETMSPQDFLSFRKLLDSASGFQSYQFREVEFLLGFKHEKALSRYPEGSTGRPRLEKRMQEPSLWSSFLQYLNQDGYPLPKHILHRNPTEPIRESAEVQAVLIQVYGKNSLSKQICELLVDFDEGFQEWRYRHVKMVERTIGSQKGTGGSPGVEYLKSTLFKSAFPDLWAIRSQLEILSE